MKLWHASLPLLVLSSTQAFGFFVDGEGNYGLRGETQWAPGFSKESGTYQAIEQTFRLKGEARFNDQSSMFLEFRLFDNPRESYLGDTAEPRECDESRTGERPTTSDPNHPCEGKHQNTGEPGYRPYSPKVTKAYIRYAFDYCIIEAGRRGRDWGLGIFMDSGDRPFSTDASLYDGVSCDINIQKTNTLGFSVGYDKLAETGSPVDPTGQPGSTSRRYGANDTADDIDQYYFSISYDDRKANAGSTFTKQIGVYFAQVSSHAYKTSDTTDKETGGSETDLKFLDLYTGFFIGDLALKNEILFRMGKSKDPNWVDLGGRIYSDGEAATNRLDSIGFAGGIDWTVSHAGAALGPVEYNQGTASRHVIFMNYAYAPGDSDGYYNDGYKYNSDADKATQDEDVNTTARNNKVTAMAFHRNFKPALLLFNGRPEADNLIVDGAFNPGRMVNATLGAMGYRYESTESGSFELKFITAQMNETPPGAVKNHYSSIKDTAADDGSRPAGFYGRSLGYELDLSYVYKVGREADLGVASAAALPGDAWRTSEDSKPKPNFLLQTSATFHF